MWGSYFEALLTPLGHNPFKIIGTINAEAPDETDLGKMNACAEPFMGYINEEHSSWIAAHTVDEDSAKIFRSFKKNTLAFPPEDVNHLALSANVAVLKNSKSDRRPQHEGRQQVYHPPYQNQYSTLPHSQYGHPGNYQSFQPWPRL